LEKQLRYLTELFDEMNPDVVKSKLAEVSYLLNLQDMRIFELEQSQLALQSSAFNGQLMWRVPGIEEARRQAQNGERVSLYSPPFYTTRHGYKMCARLYLNGDGIGQGTHLGLFFVLLRGEYDSILRWPFQQKVSFIMYDQSFQMDVITSFVPDTSSSSFSRPVKEMNVASGCPQFIKIENVFGSDKKDTYVKDDTMFFKVIVDVSNLVED